MPAQIVNLDDAKDQFSDLIASAAEGSEVVIVENDQALARLIPATDSSLYGSYPPTTSEFSSDEDPLAWEADGWDDIV